MFGCGIPIFFQEVATGQYLGSGGLTMIGQLVPMLQGMRIYIAKICFSWPSKICKIYSHGILSEDVFGLIYRCWLCHNDDCVFP